MLPLPRKLIQRDLLNNKVTRRGVKDKFVLDIEWVDEFHSDLFVRRFLEGYFSQKGVRVAFEGFSLVDA